MLLSRCTDWVALGSSSPRVLKMIARKTLDLRVVVAACSDSWRVKRRREVLWM